MAFRSLLLGWLLAAAALPVDGQVDRRNPLSQNLPDSIDLKFTMRTRVERRGGLGFRQPFDDGFLLNRARLDLSIRPAEKWRAHIQLQDSRSGGLAPGRSREGTDDALDVRLLYVEAGAPSGSPGWQLRVGRQALFLGEERIIAERRWNNVSPAWDAIRVGRQVGRDRIDFFAAAQVENDPDDIDDALSGSRIGGFYGVVESILPGGQVEPYWFFNDRPRISGVVLEREAGIHTFGTRVVGRLGSGADYSGELTGQRGYAPGLQQRGWSGYLELGWRPWVSSESPRLFAVYEQASGDADPNDGRAGTFDSGFGRRHRDLGAADAVGRSNLRTVETGLEANPAKSLALRFAYHRFLVASRRDGVYRTNGLLAVRAPAGGATASRIGDELDLIVKWTLRQGWLLEGGFGVFFAGPFLQEALDRAPQRDILYLSFEWSL